MLYLQTIIIYEIYQVYNSKLKTVNFNQIYMSVLCKAKSDNAS